MEGIPGSGKVVGAYIYRTYVMGGELDKMIERGSISTLKGTHLEPLDYYYQEKKSKLKLWIMIVLSQSGLITT
jgi:hypothetical protein